MHAVWLLLCFLSTCRAGAQEHELWDDYEDEYNIPGSDAHGGRHRRYSPYNTWAPQHRPRKADILRKDFFKQFITHFRDPAINACDNFYRHICPVSMDIRDTYQGQVQENRHDESWGIVGGAFEDEIEFDFVPDPDQLMGRQLQEEMREMVEEMHEDVPTLREEGRLLGTLMKDTLYIADRVEVMTDVLAGGNAKSERLPKIAKKLQAQMLKLLETFSREPNYEELRDKHEQAINETTVFFELVDESLEQLQGLHKLGRRAERMFEHLGFTPEEFPERYFEGVYIWRTILLPRIEEHSSIQHLLGAAFDKIGSNAIGRYVSLAVAALMPLLVDPKSDPAIAYGFSGAVMAHEFMHSMPYSLRIPGPGRRFVLVRPSEICIRERARRACQIWQEKDCFSGHHTFTEDRSDVTGLRIAWEAFRAEIREQWPSEEALKHIVYPELGVTREQLFFYTRAIRYCDTNDRSQHFMGARGLAVHSATRIRVNMVHSNMEEFAQAFNCKPGDRMVQRPTCPYF